MNKKTTNPTDASISLRDEIAIKAMTSLISREDHTGLNDDFIVNYSYKIADLMLIKRQKKKS